MEEVRVGEQFLLFPHRLLDGAGNGIEALLVAGCLGEAFRPLLDDDVARVGRAVDRVAEAHDDFLALQHAVYCFGRRLRRVELFDQGHRRFVGAAMQRAAQRTDGAGDAGMHVGEGGRADPGGEGGSVELVLGVENERDVHHAPEQIARRGALQGGEEVAGDGVFVRFQFGPHPLVAVAVPVVDDGRQGAEQTVGHALLILEIALGLQIAEHRAAGAHHVHRMRRGGNALQHVEHRLGQAAQPLELGAVGVERLGVRQFAVEDEMRDFLEGGVRRQIGDVVAPVREPGAGFAHRTQRRLAGALPAQPRAA